MLHGVSSAKTDCCVRSLGAQVDQYEKEVYAVLSRADANRDGKLSRLEFYSALRSFATTRRSRSKWRKLAALLAALVGLMLLLNMGLTAAVVFSAKDSYVAPKGQLGKSVMVDRDGDVVKTASVDMSVDATTGELVDRGGRSLKVGQALQQTKLDSRLPDEAFIELKYVYLKSPTGTLHFFVESFSRTYCDESLFGSTVHIHVRRGCDHVPRPACWPKANLALARAVRAAASGR